MKKDEVKKVVRKGYARIAKNEASCCLPADSSPEASDMATDISKKIGYTEEELKTVPQDANLGLGCGNPVALASLSEGETVLDLGSGGGLDCFLAASKVGSRGKVIGVDMTPEMIEKARENARKNKYENVEFRLGEIENLPAADKSVDAVISNCVINLSPDKRRVFAEAFRVLKPGGRMIIADLVLLKELPEIIKNTIEAYIGCLSGAMMRDKYLEAIREAGFQEVKVIEETQFPLECMTNDPTAKAVADNLKIPEEEINEIARSVISIKVFGRKPKTA
ncbi:MAG: arsenite methyltransferase [Candidatus Aminicenantales bacterium]